MAKRLAFLARIFIFLCLIFGSASLVWSDSLSYYRWRLARYPDYYYLQKRYIETLHRLKKGAVALMYLKKLQKKKPWRAQMLKGYLRALQGRIRDSTQLWHGAEKGLVGEYSNLYKLYLQYGLYREAIRFLRLVVRLGKADEKAYYRLNEVLFLQGEREAGVAVLLQLLNNSAGYSESRMRRHIRKQYITVERVAALQKALAPFFAQKKDARRKGEFLRSILATLWFRFMRYKKGYQQALFLMGDKRQHHYLLWAATVLQKSGHTKKAYSLLRKLPVFQMGSTAVMLLAKLRESYSLSGALLLYKKMERLGWRREQVLQAMARCYGKLRRFRMARTSLLRLRGMTSRQRALCGQYSLVLGELHAARRYFERLPDTMRRYYLAVLALVEGQYAVAVALAKKTVQRAGADLFDKRSLALFAFLRGIGGKKQRVRLYANILLKQFAQKPAEAAQLFVRLSKQLFGYWHDYSFLRAGQLFVRGRFFNKALTIYRDLIKKRSRLADHALFHAATLLKHKLGKKKAGNALFLDLVAKFPSSVYLYQARAELLAK